MAFLEEVFLPRVYAVLKTVDPALADELAHHIGLPTIEQQAQAEAEAAHSVAMAAATAEPVAVPVADAKAAAEAAPPEATWPEVAGKAQASS